METTNKKNAQSVSNETKQAINVENQVTNEGINVQDATTTKGIKQSNKTSDKKENKKKTLLELIDRKTGFNFESSNEYNEFYKTFEMLKVANESAFNAALASVRKQWEDANKNKLEMVENVAPVEFFEGLQTDNEIKNLLSDVFCNSFDYKKIIKGDQVLCYCSDPNKKDNKEEDKEEKKEDKKTSLNSEDIKRLDLFGKEHAQTVYYKKLSCTRSNYIRAIRGYSFYFEGEKKLKNQLNKANAAFSDLRNILQTLKNNGASFDDITRITNEIFN